MTREEARQIITDWLEWLEECKDLEGRGYIEGHFDEKDVEAFRMAIEALSQPIVCKDPCIDDDHIYCSPKMADRVVEALHADRPQWIPCSERLPRYDETSEYLVTDKYRRIRHCCLDPYMPETFVTVEEGMIVDAVAWRQAPEPLKGGAE